MPQRCVTAHQIGKTNFCTYSKGKCVSVKCPTSLADPESTTYKLTIPIFKNRNSKEWLEWIKIVECAAFGQNATTSLEKFLLAKPLHQERALQAFKIAARTAGAETTQNYKAVTKSVTTYIMPNKALQKQKHYMQRFPKKPLDMKVKDFVEQVVTMKELLTCFPDASPTVPTAKIPDNKILDLLESEMPISWQRHMVLHGFDPMDRTIAELVNFCERIKLTKELPTGKKTSRGKTGKDHNKGSKKGVKKRKPKGEMSSPYNCILHGPNKTHSIEDCCALNNIVKGAKNRTRTLDRKIPKGPKK